MKKRYYLILLSCSLSLAQESDYEQSTILKVGQELPNLTFKNIQNNELNLKDYKGKVVLINFFATWCGPCLTEIPHLQNEIWNTYKDNTNFVLLSFGREHTQEEINKFIELKKIKFPVFEDKERHIYNAFAHSYIPRNFLFDTNGKLVYSSIGYSEEEFEILKEKIKMLSKK